MKTKDKLIDGLAEAAGGIVRISDERLERLGLLASRLPQPANVGQMVVGSIIGRWLDDGADPEQVTEYLAAIVEAIAAARAGHGT